MKNLYHVQDDVRPLWVLAEHWEEALEKWRDKVRRENDDNPDEKFDPKGVQFVADADEILP